LISWTSRIRNASQPQPQRNKQTPTGGSPWPPNRKLDLRREPIARWNVLAAGIVGLRNPLDFSVPLWNLRNPNLPRVLSTCGTASSPVPWGTVAFSRDGLRPSSLLLAQCADLESAGSHEQPLSLRPPSSSPFSTGIALKLHSQRFVPSHLLGTACTSPSALHQSRHHL
jgi:hypothetical protein